MTANINIYSIREHKGQTLKGTIHLAASQLLEEEFVDGCWEDIVFDYQVTNAGELFLLEGTLTARHTQPCNRCLVSTSVQVKRELMEKFGRQAIPDEEVFPVKGDELELTSLLREHLLLSHPVKVLCDDECQGLCPQCGRNRNEQDCDCDTVSPDPRLAALEKLLPGHQGEGKKE